MMPLRRLALRRLRRLCGPRRLSVNRALRHLRSNGHSSRNLGTPARMSRPIFAACKPAKFDAMPTETITCPHCGLSLAVETDTATDFRYDVEEWRRLCKQPDLGTPVFCMPN